MSAARASLALALVGALLALAAPVAVAQGEPILDRVGTWNIQRLGASPPIELPVDQSRPAASLEFRLPALASQGPLRWYLVRLAGEIVLDPSTGSGSVFVDAATNGRTAASVEFEVDRRPGEEPVVVSKSLDLVNGGKREVHRGQRVEASMLNYLQNKGVRPGLNTLRFTVEKTGKVKLRGARILPKSGLIVSPRSPAQVDLDVRLPRRTLRLGKTVGVGVTLRNTGDRPARGIVVGAISVGRGVEVRRPARRRLRVLRGSKMFTFFVKARRAGRSRLLLSAGSTNANNPETELAVTVPKRASRAQARWPIGSVLATVAALVALASSGCLLRRRRLGRPR